jgi:hypothetical protein
MSSLPVVATASVALNADVFVAFDGSRFCAVGTMPSNTTSNPATAAIAVNLDVAIRDVSPYRPTVGR